MATVDLLVGLGILAVAGVVASVAVAGLHGWLSIRNRTIRAAPRARVVTIQPAHDEATVTIVGTVRASGGSLTAPFSGRSCCAYYATAERKDASFGASVSRPSFFDYVWAKERAAEFVVCDGTGEALVCARSRVSILWKNLTIVGDAPADRVTAFMEDELGVDGASTDWILREWTLHEGDVIAVVGVTSTDSPGDAHGASTTVYRSRPQHIEIRAPFGLNVLLIDNPAMT